MILDLLRLLGGPLLAAVISGQHHRARCSGHDGGSDTFVTEPFHSPPTSRRTGEPDGGRLSKPLTEPVRADAFEVVLARSKLTLTVPADRSILDVVEEAGASVLSSCAEGTCGTCETRVLDGEPDHRDSVLDEYEKAANDCMLICVSRACSPRLVLDL